jgi:hypothetical protein
MLIWRWLVLTRLITSDYMNRFESATHGEAIRAARWSAFIAISVYVTAFLACVLALVLGDSWLIGGILVTLVVLVARSPWITLATIWELDCIDTGTGTA